MNEMFSSTTSNTREVWKAWGVHAITASGVVLGLMATLALVNGKAVECLLWLGAAMMVDGIDGTLARRYRVKEVLPHFDGTTLDMVIDYLTWAFIPAVFILEFIALPVGGWNVLATLIIILSSMFCFCNVHMKSQDNYFVGFPAAWNILAMYLYALNLPSWISFGIIVVLAILTVTKVKFLHPFRVRTFMPLNILITLLWCLCATVLICDLDFFQTGMKWLWLATSLYFGAMCVWRTAMEWCQH